MWLTKLLKRLVALLVKCWERDLPNKKDTMSLQPLSSDYNSYEMGNALSQDHDPIPPYLQGGRVRSQAFHVRLHDDDSAINLTAGKDLALCHIPARAAIVGGSFGCTDIAGLTGMTLKLFPYSNDGSGSYQLQVYPGDAITTLPNGSLDASNPVQSETFNTTGPVNHWFFFPMTIDKTVGGYPHTIWITPMTWYMEIKVAASITTAQTLDINGNILYVVD